MSLEYKVEHLAHLGHVEGCPYCDQRLRESAEPKRTDFCLVHMRAECAEPDCYACGNHEMDDAGRCSDPRCRATNTPEVVALVAELRAAPIELVRFIIGRHFAARLWGGEPAEAGDVLTGASQTTGGKVPGQAFDEHDRAARLGHDHNP